MMTRQIFKSILLVILSGMLFSFDLAFPNGWYMEGNKLETYEMGLDKGAGCHGKNCMTIKSITATDGFGTLMHNFSPEKYLGKKIRMTGYVKSKEVSEWATLCLSIEQSTSKQGYTGDSPIKGTTDWKKYEVVLDVPSKASNISFGAMLGGSGQIWFDNLKIEIVSQSSFETPKPSYYTPHYFEK